MTTETVKAVLSKRDRRINAELEAMSIPLDSPEAHKRRDRFLGTATAANVALAEVALLETRSDTLINDAVMDLDQAVMYRRLVDQQFYAQDDDPASLNCMVTSGPWGLVEMHARLFVAGMIAERADRRRRQRQKRQAKHILQVQGGTEGPSGFEEDLP